MEKELRSGIVRVEDSIKETRDELKSDMLRVEGNFSRICGDLRSDIADLASTLRVEMRHERTVVYALCGTAIVSMVAVLAKGTFF